MLRAAGGSSGANVAITGGTIAGVTGVPLLVGKSAIPFIQLSSGSVSAAGAISGITALNRIYANAYCWFPANIVATVAAAGWRFCQFSSATAGTAFLDTYTNGTPVIPASPTAVTDGKGAFTGGTTEIVGPTYTIAASALGLTGAIRVLPSVWAANNTAGAKTARIRFGGAGGQAFLQVSLANNIELIAFTQFQNRGTAASQTGGDAVLTTSFGLSSGASPIIGVVNSALSQDLVFTLNNAVATDNLVLEQHIVEMIL